jgi:hypothetical protein
MLVFGILSTLVLAALIVTKYFTTTKLQEKKQLIAETEKTVRKFRGGFKLAENSKAAAEIDLRDEDKKKKVLDGQIQRFEQQLVKLRR